VGKCLFAHQSTVEAVGNDKTCCPPYSGNAIKLSHVGWASVYLPTNPLSKRWATIDKPVAHPTLATLAMPLS